MVDQEAAAVGFELGAGADQLLALVRLVVDLKNHFFRCGLEMTNH